MEAARAMVKGDRVREAAGHVPAGCVPYEATVTFVAEDGWVGVDLDGFRFSTPPGEVELITSEEG